MRQSGSAKPGAWIATQRGLKRLLDVVFAIIVLIILSPVILAIAVAIRLESAGGVIYRHRRIGKDGKPFDLFKFRSMRAGGDDAGYMQYLKELIESERGGNGIPYRKLNGDPRITKMGGFLRKFYLDELPQLWNVVKGEMSLMGPRPHVQFEVDYYSPEQRRRLTVRPGLTGLWQVEGKADCSFNELIALDIEYIDHWSLALDMQILLRTVGLMARGGEGFWTRMDKQAPGKGGKRFGGRWTARTTKVEPASRLPQAGKEEEV